MKTTYAFGLSALSTLTNALPQLASIDVGYTECYPNPTLSPVPSAAGPLLDLPASACSTAFTEANTHLLNVTTPFTTPQNGTFLSFPDPTKKCALQIGLLTPPTIAPQQLKYKPSVADLVAKAKGILGQCPKGGRKSLQSDNLELLSENLGWYVEVTSNIEDEVVKVTEALFGKLNEAVQALTNSTVFHIPSPPSPIAVNPPILPAKPEKPALESILSSLGINLSWPWSGH